MLRQAGGMDDPVQWGKANITWGREDGYTLRLVLWADSRALSLREDKLVEVIKIALSGRTQVAVSIFPMEVERSSEGSNAEPGEIVISTETMISLSEAARLREGITEALRGAVVEAERIVAEDEASAKSVLSILREPSS